MLLDFSDRTRTGISKLISRCALIDPQLCTQYFVLASARTCTKRDCKFHTGNEQATYDELKKASSRHFVIRSVVGFYGFVFFHGKISVVDTAYILYPYHT